jgi:hypothetical protein
METIARDACMGNLWKKKRIGATIQGNSNTMRNYVYKFLSHHSMFPKRDLGLVFRSIVMSTDCDGYTALYNIMLTVHTALTEKKVETRIPFQGIAVSFNDHVAAISNYIEKEKIRGRRYNKYEGIYLALDSLNSKYHLPLSQRAEQEFKAFSTSLLRWTDKLGLNTDFRAAKVHTISGLTCENCGDPQDTTAISKITITPK